MVKIRVRLSNRPSKTVLLTRDDNAQTLSDLKAAIVRTYPELITDSGTTRSFELSLNGSDLLGGDATPLAQLGIVDGDLLYVLCDNASVNDLFFVETGPSEEAAAPNPDRPEVVDARERVVNRTEEAMESSENSDPNHPNVSVAEICDIMSCLSEPLMVRDSTSAGVPHSLSQICLSAAAADATEAVCIVLHALMIECGFLTRDETVDGRNEAVLNSSSKCSLPREWKTPVAYKFSYTHQWSETVSCQLVCVRLQQTLIAHATCNETDYHTVQLSPSHYVNQLTSDGKNMYRKLSKLSHLFMDAIGLPLEQDLARLLGIPNRRGFSGLPYEVKLQICAYLDLVSLMVVSRVSKELYNLASDPYIWRRLYLVVFGSRTDNQLNLKWKELFVEEYKKRPSRVQTPLFPNFFLPQCFWPRRPPPFDIEPAPFGFGLRGIIGGAYDLHPIPPMPHNPFMPPLAGFPPIPNDIHNALLPGQQRPSRRHGSPFDGLRVGRPFLSFPY